MPTRKPETSLPFESAAALEAWFTKHHQGKTELLLRISKKGSGTPSVTYAEAVELALRHGWIDGVKRPLDEHAWIQRFTPRGPKSVWSQINRDKAEALIAAGKMTARGLAEVARAKEDGRWAAAYASPRSMEEPPELTAALKKNKAAGIFFKTLSSANRYAILYRLHHAKKPETRTRKLGEIVEMLARGETFHPQKPKKAR
jgi:uncharacterized protein YdeI (YjbR/CyaY-like superfamily)